MLCIMYTGSQSLPADSNKSNIGSTVLNHLGPNMIHCTGHKYWHYDIMTSWHHMNDITCMVTEGFPPLVALHMHCWLRTGQLWCMWNSQSVHLKVFWNIAHAYLHLHLVVILVAVGGHMISMKARRETTVTTSNRFQQSGRWSANFSIKPLLISIIS